MPFAVVGATHLYELFRDIDKDPMLTKLENVCTDFSFSAEIVIPTCELFLKFKNAPSALSRAGVALASAYAGKGDHARALATYAEAIRNNPENTLAFALLAREQIQTGACSLAVENLQRAIALDSQASWLDIFRFGRPSGLLDYQTHELGEAYACLSDWPKAVASYGQAVEVRRKILAGKNVFGYRSQLAGSLAGRAAAAEAMGDHAAAARDRAEADQLREKPRP